MKPTVSILMTVWNGAAFLAEAIESVLSQITTSTWELVIVDDGSSDKSATIAKAFAARDKRIRILSHPQGINCGISASRNLAMASARGELLAFLDADDVWLPYRLEHHLEKLRAYPQVAMIYGQAERWWDPARHFDEDRHQNGANFIPPLVPCGQQAGLLLPPTLLQWFLNDESFTPCTCSVLVRTSVARQLGGFEGSFRGLYDDQVFYAKISLAESVFVDERCVARYRRHPGSCCWRAGEGGASCLVTAESARIKFLTWLSDYMRRLGLSGLRIDLDDSTVHKVQPGLSSGPPI